MKNKKELFRRLFFIYEPKVGKKRASGEPKEVANRGGCLK